MKASLVALGLLLLLSVASGVSLASSLDITIRAHAKKVIFGDPIYLDVTILNTGDDSVRGFEPDVLAGNCDFVVRELKTNLQFRCTGQLAGIAAATLKPIEYLPGKPFKIRWMIFAPYNYELEHPFWKAAQEDRMFQIWFVLALEKKVSLRSDPITVQLEARDNDELKALQKWSIRANQQPETNISPMNLGVHLSAVNTRQKAKRAAEQIMSGGLGELLRLVVQMQELYDSPDNRQAGATVLLNWLKTQPDIKRQILCDRIGQAYAWLPPEHLRTIKNMAESGQ